MLTQDALIRLAIRGCVARCNLHQRNRERELSRFLDELLWQEWSGADVRAVEDGVRAALAEEAQVSSTN
jgi:hypothetical protein